MTLEVDSEQQITTHLARHILFNLGRPYADIWHTELGAGTDGLLIQAHICVIIC